MERFPLHYTILRLPIEKTDLYMYLFMYVFKFKRSICECVRVDANAIYISDIDYVFLCLIKN